MQFLKMPRGPFQQPHRWATLEEHDESTWDSVGNHGSALAIADTGADAFDEEELPHHQYREMDWATMNKCAKRDFNTWLAKHTPLHMMIICRMILEPHRLLMGTLLEQTADAWQKKQFEEHVNNPAASVIPGLAQYRILNAAQHKHEDAFLKHVSRLLLDADEWVALSLLGGAVRDMSTLAFRMLARSGAACVELMSDIHLNYPYILFLLLGSSAEDHRHPVTPQRMVFTFSTTSGTFCTPGGRHTSICGGVES